MPTRAEIAMRKAEIDKGLAEGDLQPSDLTPQEMTAALHRMRRRLPSSKVAPEG
jgi:hypothetical protein